MSDGSLRQQEPGVLNQTLFGDVPYILETAWRVVDYHINRLGTVEHSGAGVYEPKPRLLNGGFMMYLIMSAYAVFGPTLDQMCAINLPNFAQGLRLTLAITLLTISTLIFFLFVNHASYQLARRAQQSVENQSSLNSSLRQRWLRVSESLRGDPKMAAVNRMTGKSHFEFFFGNVTRLIVALVHVHSRDRVALLLAFILLLWVALIITSPIISTAVVLGVADSDKLACIQKENASLLWAQLAGLAVLAVGGVCLWWRWWRDRPFFVFAASTAMLVTVVVILWAKFTPVSPSEAVGGFYPHVYVVVVFLLLGMILLARLLAWALLRGFSRDYGVESRDALIHTDLLQNSSLMMRVGAVRVLSTLISGILRHPLLFLLLPAYIALIGPTVALPWLVPTYLAASMVLLMNSGLSTRYEQKLVTIERWFLVGIPLVLSVAVIAIGGLRLIGFQYVSTMIDATPTGVLFVIVVMMYVAAWMFEYWINRWIGGELLRVLGGEEASRTGFLPCNLTRTVEFTWANTEGRFLALHGNGRMCAVGSYEPRHVLPGEPTRRPAFTTYTFLSLFSEIYAQSRDGTHLENDIRRRVTLYFHSVNSLLVLVVVGLLMWNHGLSQPLAVEPMVDVQPATAKQSQPLAIQTTPASMEADSDQLGERLSAQAAKGRSSIVVAASGGGTRAAVYTAVALEGIAKLDRAKDVVMLSGVSGGGVSAAVFASRFESLTTTTPKPDETGNPWSLYVKDVGEPFIQDVLEGVGELRIWGPTSVGALLQESLERRAFNQRQTSAHWLGDVTQTGLILNTSISGHPYEDSEILRDRIAVPAIDAPCVSKSRPYSNLAGGRLVFTNLHNLSGFPESPTDVPDMWLPYRIINFGDVRLSSAAALTANFPPVFSNARVQIEPQETGTCPQSYFVTDGGATENLGLVSALYALLGTLNRLPKGTPLSNIHVLALEASAIDYDYSDDRGIGAATGGSKERVNAGLTQVLLTELRNLAKEKHGVDLYVHYLPLPVAFRSRGGFGTHWMFAPYVRVANPHLPDHPEDPVLPSAHRDKVTLDRSEVTVTMRALFDPIEPICDLAARIHDRPETAEWEYSMGWTVDTQRVARWICRYDDQRGRKAPKPDYHVDAWKETIASIKPTS